MKSRIIILLFIFITAGLTIQVFAENKGVLRDLLKPQRISVDEEHIYVVDDGTNILIYDRKDYKLIKKFGEKGEGPRQFNLFAFVNPLKDKLMINSLAKVSYFTKSGEYISEKRGEGMNNFMFYPLENGFIGFSQKAIDDVLHSIINLYDKDLKKVKELYRQPMANKDGKFVVPNKGITYQTHNNKIYISAKPGFVLEILDSEGKVIKTIEKEKFKKQKFSDEDKKIFMEILKKQMKASEEVVNSRIQFNNQYPAIMASLIDNKCVYILTWEGEILKTNKVKIYQYDLDGNYKDEFFTNFVVQDNLQAYPFGVYDEKLYQLIDNENEQWELHVTDLQSK